MAGSHSHEMELLAQFIMCASGKDIWGGFMQVEQLNENKHHTGTLSIWEGETGIIPVAGCRFTAQSDYEKERENNMEREEECDLSHPACLIQRLKTKAGERSMCNFHLRDGNREDRKSLELTVAM